MTDNLSGRQVTIEALPPVEQKEHSSAQPAWDEIQSVPRAGLGYEHGLDGVVGTDVKQPFASAIGSRRVAADTGATTAALCTRLSRNACDTSVIALKSSMPA